MRSAAAAAPPDWRLGTSIADALGPAGIRGVERCGSRLLVELADPSKLSTAALEDLDVRGWVAVENGVQIIVGPDAEKVGRMLVGRVE